MIFLYIIFFELSIFHYTGDKMVGDKNPGDIVCSFQCFLNNGNKSLCVVIKPKFVFINWKKSVLIHWNNQLSSNEQNNYREVFANRIKTCDMINVYRPPAGKIGQIVKENIFFCHMNTTVRTQNFLLLLQVEFHLIDYQG